MVDFENGRKEQIQILKKQTEIKVTAPEQQKLDAFKVQRSAYEDNFIVSQLENQVDFYADYKKKWSDKYSGQKIYRANIPDKQEILIQNDNLGYFDRRTRRKTAVANKNLWKKKIRQVVGLGTKDPFGLDTVEKPGTYADDLMQGTLKFIRIEKKKRELQREAFKDDEDENELLAAHKKDLLALAPEIKINGDGYSDTGTFDEDSVNAYKEYLQKAIKDPVNAIKDAVMDAIYSFETLSPKLFERHAVPQRFEVIKQLRDKFEAIDNLTKTPKVKDEVTEMMQGLLHRTDSKGKAIDLGNFEYATFLYKAMDADLTYSLDHYGVKYADNGLLVTKKKDKDPGYTEGHGKLTKALVDIMKSKQDRGTHRINSVYWREQARELIKKDDEEENNNPGEAETDILKAVKFLDGKVDNNADDGKRGHLYNNLAENAKKIAAAITVIDKEIADSADVFERRKSELTARPILKQKLQKYIENRKQEQLDLIDRAGGYLNALRNVALGEDLTTLGKQILMENQTEILNENQKIDEIDEDNLFAEDMKQSEDGFVVIGNASIKSAANGVTDSLSTIGHSLMPYDQVKKKLLSSIEDKEGEEYRKIREYMGGKNAEIFYRLLQSEGKNILAMKPKQLAQAFDNCNVELQAVVAKLKTNLCAICDEVDEKFEQFNTTSLEKLSRKEVNKLIKDAYAVRSKFIGVASALAVKCDNKGNDYSVFMNYDVAAEDKKRFIELKRGANLKFKILCDKIDQYKYSNIIQRIKVGDTSTDMYTDDEKAYIDYIYKTTKFKDGKYEGGKSPEQLLVEFFKKKKAASDLSRTAHTKEYGEYLAKLMAQDAEKDEQAFLPEDERQQVQKKKSLKDILQPDENIAPIIEEKEEEEEADKELKLDEEILEEKDEEYDEDEELEEQLKLIRGVNGEKKEKKVKKENKKEDKKEDEEVKKEEKKDEVIKNEDEVIKNEVLKNEDEEEKEDKEEKKEEVLKREDRKLDKFNNYEADLFDMLYFTVPKFDIESKNPIEYAKAIIFNLISAESSKEITDNKEVFEKKLSDTKLSERIGATADKLKGDGFKNGIYGDNKVVIQDKDKDPSIAVDKTSKDYLWIVNLLSRATDIDTIFYLKQYWIQRKDYLSANGEQVNPVLFYKVLTVLNAFETGKEINNERQQVITRVKDSLTNYNEQLTSFSLLDSDEKQAGKDLKPEDYKFTEHQKNSNSCWAASHTYVINTYLKANKKDIGAGAPKKFTQDTFLTKKNLKIHPNVRPKLNETKNDNAGHINFTQEAKDILGFLENNRMGNPYTVADTVIDKIPKTAEKRIFFNKFATPDITLDKQMSEKLGDYILLKAQREMKKTGAPISLLYRRHYYSIVGIDADKKAFKCFNSLNTGEELNKTEDLSIAEILSSGQFEMVFPVCLNRENLNDIADEFGLSKNLYNVEGDMYVDAKIKKMKQINLDNPVNLAHVNGVEFDKPENLKEHAFERAFFNEQIYMPRNLNMPKKLADEKKNGKK